MSDVGDTAGVSADLHSSTASSIYSTMQAGREWRSGGGSGPAYKREPFPSVSRAQRASVIIIVRRSSTCVTGTVG